MTYTAITQAIIAPLMIFGSWEVMRTIQTGQIASDLTKPLDFYGFWLAQDLGRSAFHVLARGVPIAEHQMVQAMIAEMGIKYEATRLLVHKCAWQIDNGGRNSLVASYSKAFGADSAMQVATDAVQVFGGNGYITEYPVEKYYRDAKIGKIYEGTSNMQLNTIAKVVYSD